jgi:hypothetical protein
MNHKFDELAKGLPQSVVRTKKPFLVWLLVAGLGSVLGQCSIAYARSSISSMLNESKANAIRFDYHLQDSQPAYVALPWSSVFAQDKHSAPLSGFLVAGNSFATKREGVTACQISSLFQMVGES